MSWSEGNVTSDRISMDASPLTGHWFDKLVAYCVHSSSLFSVRFPGGVRAASPLTSSSNAHDDELGCHRLAAGEGFGRPARYFVHYIYSEDLHQQQTWTHTQTGTHTHTSHTETHASTYSDTHTDRDSYTHRHRYTHTETHTLPQLTRLNASH